MLQSRDDFNEYDNADDFDERVNYLRREFTWRRWCCRFGFEFKIFFIDHLCMRKMNLLISAQAYKHTHTHTQILRTKTIYVYVAAEKPINNYLQQFCSFASLAVPRSDLVATSVHVVFSPPYSVVGFGCPKWNRLKKYLYM